jgi:hypothetical protein
MVTKPIEMNCGPGLRTCSAGLQQMVIQEKTSSEALRTQGEHNTHHAVTKARKQVVSSLAY